VLRRVPGGIERREFQAPDADPLTASDGPVAVGELGARADDVNRPRQRRELARPGHVIVVEVRLEDVADHEVVGRRSAEVDVDVAAGIDDGGEAGRLIGDEG
jgi:hypothetical protein